MIYTLKARTLRKIKKNKDGQEVYVDLTWLDNKPKVGETIELKNYKDEQTTHIAEVFSKFGDGFYLYVPDWQ